MEAILMDEKLIFLAGVRNVVDAEARSVERAVRNNLPWISFVDSSNNAVVMKGEMMEQSANRQLTCHASCVHPRHIEGKNTRHGNSP
jgi:hypothetical protein